ncbi:MAG: hypothetical protein L6R38_000437 [Xanthoria sp. 2 TBL-2021]|nr:MAG: hypothetical protein L6R38_000437 [Xanthoria sp. 2 TBL-2021]
MAKVTRGRRKSSPKSEDDSSSDKPQISTGPSKGRKKSNTQRTEAGPSQKRRPIRRTSMPGAYPSGSDDDTSRKPSGRRDGPRQQASKRADSDEDEQAIPRPRRQTGNLRSSSPADEPTAPASRRPKKYQGVDRDDEETERPSPQSGNLLEESYEEQMRRAIALSLAQPASTRPSEEPDEEKQMRWAMEASTTHAEASARPSSSANAEAEYLRKLKESQDDHEALQRRRAQEAEKIQENEAYLARVLKESPNEAHASGHQNGEVNEEDRLEEILRLSMETAAEDQRRAEERMRWTSRSWTENNPRAMERGEKPQESSSSAAPPAPSNDPAADSPKPKARKFKNPLSQGKKKTKTSALDAVPEDTVATSSSSRPLRTGSSSGDNPQPDNSRAIAIRQSKPIPEATSQALVELREPPIKIETLIAMCERAFPQDGAIAQAMKDSQKSDYIYRVQHGDEEDERNYAAAVALSEQDKEPDPDISEIGVTQGEEAPAYRKSAQDKVIDHFKYTSSDYRNEKAGTRKPITKEIWEIMRQYQVFVAWAKGIDPKGKSKEGGQLVITPPTLPSSSTTNSSAPAEVNSSLDETTRPSLREDFAVPNPEEVSHVMRKVDPKNRTAQRLMQNQSHAIGQSRMTGVRPRPRPEAHMSPFGRLPIMVEGNEQVAEASRGQMAKSTARKVKRNANYKRSGI